MPYSIFLEEHQYIDFSSGNIQEKATELFSDLNNSIEIAKTAYEYVRDCIPHSFDIQPNAITAKASDVLKHRTGICHAKSNLLAALLRAQRIPAGFCFQRIILSDIGTLRYCVHCFNALFVASHWIRVDASGNTNGKNAQFSLAEPQLAFPDRNSGGEFFWDGIYAKPHLETMIMLDRATSIRDILHNIPDHIIEKPDIVL